MLTSEKLISTPDREKIYLNRDIFIFGGGNKRLRNVTKFSDVRDFDRNAANWQ
jgi:hypothetical protein